MEVGEGEGVSVGVGVGVGEAETPATSGYPGKTTLFIKNPVPETAATNTIINNIVTRFKFLILSNIFLSSFYTKYNILYTPIWQQFQGL